MKKEDTLPEIVIMRDSLLVCAICSSIPPERMNEIPDKLYQITGNIGTSNGRWEFADYAEHPEAAPIPCEDYENRWHYIMNC